MKDLNLERHNIVTQANTLVEARYTITKNEQLILLAMISFIDPKDKDFLTYKTSISQFADLLGLDKKNYLKEVATITHRLLSRVVKIETPNGWEMYQWVSYAKANYKEDTLLLRFHDHLKPYLLELRSRFTSFKLDEVVDLKSIYAIRIYQLLRDFNGRGIQQFTYTLFDFREVVLGEKSKKYPIFNNFKVRILDKSKQELDEKSNLTFTYETSRVGRKIGKITFTVVKQNKRKKEEIPESVPKLSAKNTTVKIESTPEIQELLNIGISTYKASQVIQQYPTEYIREKINILKEKQSIEKVLNPSGFLIKAIDENWKSEATIQKEKEAERVRKAREKEEEEWRIRKLEERKTKLGKEFSLKSRTEYIDLLNDKEKEALKQFIFNEVKKTAPFLLSLIKNVSLLDPSMSHYVVRNIPNFEEKKQKYIEDNL